MTLPISCDEDYTTRNRPSKGLGCGKNSVDVSSLIFLRWKHLFPVALLPHTAMFSLRPFEALCD